MSPIPKPEAGTNRTPKLTPAHGGDGVPIPFEPPGTAAGAPSPRGPTGGDPADTRPAHPPNVPAATGPPSPTPAPPGYEVERELGRGGMGVVYKARQTSLNRPVALKVILAGGHAGTDDLVRFRREAEAAAKLRHPNVVQVYEVGRFDGRPYFTLEYVEGGSLAKYARDPPSPREAAAVVEQVARGVAHAHANGIVHRDLKPDNVLLDGPDRIPKVADFGLAKTLDSGDGLTATGAVMGTPSYMAPEQAAGDSKRVGPAADVWALGAILYRLLTGRPPFAAPTPLETMRQVLAADPAPPRRLAAGVPRDLETICLKCLRKDPSHRYATADAVAEDLRLWLRGMPIAARPVGPLKRSWAWLRRHRGPAVGVVTLALVLLGGVVATRLNRSGLVRGEPPLRYELTGERSVLYVGGDPGSHKGWSSTGSPVTIERDEHGGQVLSGTAFDKRLLPYKAYRVTVGLDLHKASAAEIGVAARPDDRLMIRISRSEGAALGVRTGKGYEPLGPWIVSPAPANPAGQRPYLEVKWERAGGRWAAWFCGQKLGDFRDDGWRMPELHVRSEGGPVRIDRAIAEELWPVQEGNTR
jgi:predicted Ser/Thr protein kinase